MFCKINQPKQRILFLTLSRLIVQLAFFMLLPELFALVFTGYRAFVTPLLEMEFSVPFDISKLIAAIAVTLITALAGRVFCGWICAYGTAVDVMHLFKKYSFKRMLHIGEKTDKALKLLKYFILLFIILFSWKWGFTFISDYNPWDTFGQLFDLSYILSVYKIGFIFMLLTLLPSLLIERFFCRYLCPLGAVFNIFSRVKIFKLKKDPEKCGSCKLCTHHCGMNINLNGISNVKSGECINCLNCVIVCPGKNMHYTLGNQRPHAFAITGTAIVLICAIYGIPLFNSESPSPTTSPVFGVQSGISDSGSIETKDLKETRPYKDGSYIGIARGYREGLHVEVTIINGNIAEVNIQQNNEDKLYLNACSPVISSLIKRQSTELADTVTGATKTSTGILRAVEDALSKAG